MKGLAWTPEQDALLLKLQGQHPRRDIGAILGRSPRACSARLYALRHPHPTAGRPAAPSFAALQAAWGGRCP